MCKTIKVKKARQSDTTAELNIWYAGNVLPSSTDAEWMEEADISTSASRLAGASQLANLPDSNMMMRTVSPFNYIATVRYLTMIYTCLETSKSHYRFRRSSEGNKSVLPAFTCSPVCVVDSGPAHYASQRCSMMAGMWKFTTEMITESASDPLLAILQALVFRLPPLLKKTR